MTKQQLGQFFTTNYNYIFSDISPFNVNCDIIEPFCGNGDLLEFIKKFNPLNIVCYDIEPKHDYITKQDTLLNPPQYINKFVITNPPYLARNKATDKTIYDKYNSNDLYKCFLYSLIKNTPNGGIIIIPSNFFCSIRKSDIELRKLFLSKFNIIKVNFFEETVFKDTSYSVCSIYFNLNTDKQKMDKFTITIFPSKKQIDVELNEKNNYIIGGEMYKLPKSSYKITRATSKNINNVNTNIVAKCMDDNQKSMIKLFYTEKNKEYIDTTPNLTFRSYCLLIIEPEITKELQKKLIVEFNNFLNDKRNNYNSLFLTNYRESNTIQRKRISFDMIYSICSFLLIDLK